MTRSAPLTAAGPTRMSWAERGACRDVDPDTLFVPGAAQHRAKRVCDACPVRTECLAEALDNRMEFGIWGGLTERERRSLLRRRPDVVSWRPLLEAMQTGPAQRARAR